MGHYLTAAEKAQLEPRPKLAKFCARRHRLRTPDGLATNELLLYFNGSHIEAKGCRACKKSLRSD